MPARAAQAVSSLGTTATYYSATNTTPGEDRVPPGALLHVKTSGSTGSLTLVTTGVIDGDLAVADRAVTPALPATGERFVRVPTNEFYRDPADGLVGLTWTTSVTGITFAVLA